MDYFDTFSPVTKLSSFRFILAIATCNDWDADTFNFNGVYLNGELDDNEEIYMKLPSRYISEGEQVKCLLKSLYGLKQAGQKWYNTLSRTLMDLGFQVNNANPGVFTSHNNADITILTIHVNNCLITGSSTELILNYKSKFNEHCSLTNLGPVHWLLGIKIMHSHQAHTISLSQTSYIDTILSHFSFSNAKPVVTPITPGTVLSKADLPIDDTEMVHMSKTPYCEAIGSLMYAAVTTHPNIAFVVLALSQFLENPGESSLGSHQASSSLSHWHQNSHSHMEMSTTIYLDSQMLMEHHRSTVMPFLAMHSSLMEQQFPGPHATKSWSLCLLPRLNTWQPPTPQRTHLALKTYQAVWITIHTYHPLL